MARRLGFVVSLCGMAFVLLPLSRLMERPDFVISTIGFTITILGIFFALESLAKKP